MGRRFSIIVPTYNVEDFLAECLESLLGQTFSDYEIIVVDDVSKDSSLQIARDYEARYPQKLRVLAQEVNKGPGGTRNSGIAAATGAFLLFVDSDDYLMPDTLEKVDALLTQTGADIAEFCFRLVDEQRRYLSRTHTAAQMPALARTINACNKAIRASLFDNIRFPENRTVGEDYCTVPKLLMQARSSCGLDEDLYCYRQRSGSSIHSTDIEKNREIMRGTDDLIAYCVDNGLQERMMPELTFLAIHHVLYHASLRVCGIDRRSPILGELRDYMNSRFPEHKENPLRSRLTSKEKMLLKLIEAERWDMLYLRYHCRNRLTGFVKRLLWKLKGK